MPSSPSDLPVEIFELIMTFVLPLKEPQGGAFLTPYSATQPRFNMSNSESEYQNSLLNLCLTSKDFKNLLYAIPHFWSSIRVHMAGSNNKEELENSKTLTHRDLATAACWIQRSGSGRIKLTLVFAGEDKMGLYDDHLTQLVDDTIGFGFRLIEKLCVIGLWDALFDLVVDPSPELPGLRSLEFRPISDNQPRSSFYNGSPFPQRKLTSALENLHVDNQMVKFSTLPVNWASLKCLSLDMPLPDPDMSYLEIFDYLRLCSGLEKLQLTIFSLGSKEPPDAFRPPVTLPRLSVVSVHFRQPESISKVFNQLHAPEIRQVFWISLNRLVLTSATSISKYVAKNGATITDLTTSLVGSGLFSLLPCMPTLEKLSLGHNADNQGTSIEQDFLARLTASPTTLCPLLKELDIGWSDTISTDNILSFVKTKQGRSFRLSFRLLMLGNGDQVTPTVMPQLEEIARTEIEVLAGQRRLVMTL